MLEGLHKIVSAEQTIVAISTPQGRGGLGIVRLSGRDAVEIALRFFQASGPLQPRQATYGAWRGDAGDIIDHVVVTYFRRPQSYTGEDVVEVSAHGNPLVLRRIVTAVQSAGARPAAPGEFTLRAVSNGKMDLIQAEAVREFIAAQTEHQARTALRQMDGALSKRIRPIKQQVIDIIARLEAGIDFAEDDVDIPENAAVVRQIEPLCAALRRVQETFGYGKILASGLCLAILGKPNVGKSSLFNRFVCADRAIVTDIPGTTRDVLTETVELDGIPLRFADTAGVRHPSDPIEQIGVTRAMETIAEADLVLIVLDGSVPFDEDDREVLAKVAGVQHLLILNKVDLPPVLDTSRLNGARLVRVSARTGHGMEDLRASIHDHFLARKTEDTDAGILTNARQHEAIGCAAQALQAAGAALAHGIPHEMALLDLYGALSALDELTGEAVTEDILDRIFSTFCIGK